MGLIDLSRRRLLQVLGVGAGTAALGGGVLAHPSEAVGTVEKCSLSVHRIADGQQPSCVVSCPAQARIFGDLNAPDSRINRLLEDRGGDQLLDSKGTEPKVRYLTPRRRRSL